MGIIRARRKAETRSLLVEAGMQVFAGRRDARRATPQGRSASARLRAAGDAVAAWREAGMIHRVTDLIPVVLLALACFVGGYVLLSRLLRGLSSQQPRLRKEPIPPAW